MQTITLNVNDTVYDKFQWFLSHFSKNELYIIEQKNTIDNDIEQISHFDEDFKTILHGREERISNPENYGTLNDFDSISSEELKYCTKLSNDYKNGNRNDFVEYVL